LKGQKNFKELKKTSNSHFNAFLPLKIILRECVGRFSEPDRLTKHGRDARATGSEGLGVRASFDSQQMKQIKQIVEQKAGG